MLTKLRLSGLGSSLEIRLQEASASGLTHREFLELVLQDELLIRNDRAMQRRITMAGFRDVKRLEDFDFGFNPSIKKNVVFELAACRFVREKRDALLLGPPGTGKSHLVQGVGLAAIRAGFTVYYRSIFDVVRDFLHDEAMDGHERVLQKYLKPDLLIIDDMGMKQLPKRSGEYLFEVVMRRHELRSTMMTSNRPLEEWGKWAPTEGWSGDVPAATAILDRFLHHAEVLQLTGRSYRLEKARKSSKDTKAPTGSAAEEK
jgi:DNA replication protein DnaC